MASAADKQLRHAFTIFIYENSFYMWLCDDDSNHTANGGEYVLSTCGGYDCEFCDSNRNETTLPILKRPYYTSYTSSTQPILYMHNTILGRNPLGAYLN